MTLPPSPRDVVVTGIGVLTPIGQSLAEVRDSLVANRSGITLWQAPELEQPIPVGSVPGDHASHFTKLELPYMDRCSQLAVLAAQQALRDAGIADFSDCGTRAGLFYGSVAGGVRTQQDWVRQFYEQHAQGSRPYTLMASMLNAAPVLISIRHKISGPVISNSSACASSGIAIGEACSAIRSGRLDVAVAGGAEAALQPSFLALWNGLRAMAAPDPVDVSRSCRPFARNRTGLVVSEGAVFLVLESRERAERRGAACHARISGYGVASDAYHIGSPHADGQAATLRAALDDAGLQPQDIGYYNAHATATRGGDPVETAAVRNVFGAHVDALPVSSTKAIHGHLLGAASAIEAVACMLGIAGEFLPATAHLDDVDPECALHHVANTPWSGRRIDHALSLSAGFGGTNVALAISREHELPQKTLQREAPVH